VDREVRSLELDGRTVSYELRRSGRAKWMRAEVALRTGLRVTLPAGGSESAIEPFLRSRRRWLFRALKRFERLSTIIPDRKLEHGARVPYLGSELTLDLAVGPARVGRLADTLIVSVPRRTPKTIRETLRAWYSLQAHAELSSRATAIAAKHGLTFRKIVIGDQKSRWGSCYPNGTIALNWRLLLAPDAVATYLVCHELAHLAHPNHSKAYWAQVEKLCPLWRDQEKWLRKFGLSLTL
jgi:hypothetical protein